MPANTVLNSFFVSVELIADVILIMRSVTSSTETKKEFSTVLAGTVFLNTAYGDLTDDDSDSGDSGSTTSCNEAFADNVGWGDYGSVEQFIV